MSEIVFSTNRADLYSELFNVVRQFFPYERNEDIIVTHTFEKGSKAVNKICVNGDDFIFTDEPVLAQDKLVLRRLELRQIKIALYKALQGYFKRPLPWGALTGVRPTKLAYEMLSGGIRADGIASGLIESYLVSQKKAELIQDIIANQSGIFFHSGEYVNFYVHIPFCPSRCYYCSFVSVPLEKQKGLVDKYVDTLIEEIRLSADILEKQNKKVYSVYIGGGTPTALNDGQFEKVLKAVPYKNVEYTCEAGRPDTITEAKAELMKRYNVTRVSVNPQSLNPQTLLRIGRNHTPEDFFKAYSLIKSCGFDINTDLIAGLKGESLEDFQFSLDGVIKNCRPENITVHTLSRKNGSLLKESEICASLKGGQIITQEQGAESMLEYAHKVLPENGYSPYYLYRQKNMVDNLENAGYCLKGKQCVNNITTMEECLGVMACGAGAISKLVEKNGEKIERFPFIKDVKMYNEEFGSRFKKKENFWQNQFTTI